MYHSYYYIPSESKVQAEYDFGPHNEREERFLSNMNRVARWIDYTSREECIHPYMPAFDEHEPWNTYYRYLPFKKHWPEGEISSWVKQTLQSPLANPFTPQTPRSLTPVQREREPLSSDRNPPDSQPHRLNAQGTPQVYAYSKTSNWTPHDRYVPSHSEPRSNVTPTYSYVEPSNWGLTGNRYNENDSDEASTSSTDTEIDRPNPNNTISNLPSVPKPIAFDAVMPLHQQATEPFSAQLNAVDQLRKERTVEVPTQAYYMAHPTNRPYANPSIPLPAIAQAPPEILPLSSPYSDTLSSVQSSALSSICSYPSSRTESTDYGIFYTRMAISQESDE